MSIFWKNPSETGIGDRLLDLLNFTTYAAVKGKHLKCVYPFQPFTFTDYEKSRPTYRLEDYKLSNIKTYMNLPESLHLYLYKHEVGEFDEVIEATHYNDSPFTFHERLKPPCSIFQFVQQYLEFASSISFNLPHPFTPTTPYMTVHLRRTDKVWDYKDNIHHGIQVHELDELNTKTMRVMDELIRRGIQSVYFCGDDRDVIDFYSSIYSDRLHVLNHQIKLGDEIEQVYFDLHMLANSSWIILSQRHSSFSLFASMIKQAKLVYLYESDTIENMYYTFFPHILHYTKLFQTCTILGHQGFGDLFSQNAIYTHYAQIYQNTTILALNDSVKKVLDAMFQSNPTITCSVPTFQQSDPTQTCVRCHMSCSPIHCNRDLSKQCISFQPSTDHSSVSIKLGAFKNYTFWSKILSTGQHFVNHFYTTEFFHPHKKFTGFSLSIDPHSNQSLVSSLSIQRPYAVIHEIPDGKILRNTIDPSLEIINLHGLSNQMIDIIDLLLGADEIHVVDSSYSLLIYYLTFSNKAFQEKKVFLHCYARSSDRDTRIYEDPWHTNWIRI